MSSKETWKPIALKRGKGAIQNYAVSSLGRIASYTDSISDHRVLRMSDNSGFLQVNTRSEGRSKAILVHRAVADAFLKKPSSKHSFVLHLDYDKKNNQLSNLKWATQREQVEHIKKSPHVILAKKKRMVVGHHSKTLDAKKVQKMKEMIWDPKRKKTLSQIARQFGVSEMNVYRIKAGEFWYHIHVEHEPMHAKYKEYLKNAEYHEKVKQKAEKEKEKKQANLKAKAKPADKKDKKGKDKKEAKAKNKQLAKLLKHKKKK